MTFCAIRLFCCFCSDLPDFVLVAVNPFRECCPQWNFFPFLWFICSSHGNTWFLPCAGDTFEIVCGSITIISDPAIHCVRFLKVKDDCNWSIFLYKHGWYELGYHRITYCKDVHTRSNAVWIKSLFFR